MEKDGLLIKNDEVSFGRKRVYYKATKTGEKEFQEIKMKVVELYKEVVEGSK
jgi:DNA-binding PadR family transcriptional regulator